VTGGGRPPGAGPPRNPHPTCGVGTGRSGVDVDSRGQGARSWGEGGAVFAHEVCSLSFETRYRGKISFTVCCVRRLRLDRVYLLASRVVVGLRGLSFTVRKRAPESEIIETATYLARCLAFGEEAEDRRLLAQVGADGQAITGVEPLT